MFKLKDSVAEGPYKYLRPFRFEQVELGWYRVLTHPTFTLPAGSDACYCGASSKSRKVKENEMAGAIYGFNDQVFEVMEEVPA